MDIRPLTDAYAVSPQIAPEDAPAIAEAGFTTVICNRPDAEVAPDYSAAAIRAAVEAAGMTFIDNPVTGGAISMDNVATQGAAQAEQPAPVLAYCASGNRCCIVWALSQAGARPTDELIATAARHGYALEPFRQTIEQLAAG